MRGVNVADISQELQLSSSARLSRSPTRRGDSGVDDTGTQGELKRKSRTCFPYIQADRGIKQSEKLPQIPEELAGLFI